MENIIERIKIVEGPFEIVNARLNRNHIGGGIDEIWFESIEEVVRKNEYHYLIKENPKLKEHVEKNDVFGFIDEAKAMGGKLSHVDYRLTSERIKEERKGNRWLDIAMDGEITHIWLSEKEFEEYKRPSIIKKFEVIEKLYV